jgi:Tol biopolymer transport system component
VRIGDGRSYGLSPDGRWALTARQPPSVQLTLLPTGAGEPRQLAKSEIACQWANFFPDGKRILLSGNEPGRGIRMFIQDLAGGKPRAITPEGVSAVRTYNPVSPDGKSIAAFGSDGRLALYPTEPGEPRELPGLGPEEWPIGWTADGRAVYVMRPSGSPGRIDLVDVQTGRRTLWKQFQPPDPAGVQQIGPAVIASDGSSFVYSYRRVLDDLYVATGIR